MNIPTVKKMSQSERFTEGFKMLLKECDCEWVKNNVYGMTSMGFKDGSELTAIELLIDAGVLTREKFNTLYGF